MNIISKEEINTGRQAEVDIAKTMVIFCLAIVHCTINCSTDEALESGLPYLFDTVIGGPMGAPIFMFMMGVGLSYTSKNSPMDVFHRGILMFLLGFILNIFRFAIPFLIGFGLTGEREMYIDPMVYRVFCCDIMQFAGIWMMVMGLLFFLKFKNWMILSVSLILQIISGFFNDYDFGSPFLNIFLGHFIGTEYSVQTVYSDFPILNWMIVPTVGFLFGGLLKRVSDKKAFYRITTPILAIIVTVYFVIGIRNEYGMFGEGQNCYYHIIFSDVIICIAYAICVLGIYYYISLVLPKKVIDILTTISVNINGIYCIHWIFVSMITYVILYKIRGTMILSMGPIFVISTLITIAAITISIWYRKSIRVLFTGAKK